MNEDNTMSLQQVRRDPLSFLRQIKEGKKITVIYHSKPYATVVSADSQPAQPTKNTRQLLRYAELARRSAKATVPASKDYKQLYSDDMAKKYGIS